MSTDDLNDRQGIITAANMLGQKVDKLSSQLTISKAQIEKNNRNTRILYGVFALMAAIIVVLTITVNTVAGNTTDVKSVTNSNKQQADCVAKWADAYTRRANLITSLGVSRTDALDRLVRTFTLSGSNQSTQFSQALAAYLQASDTYSKALATNPIPPSPVFNCG